MEEGIYSTDVFNFFKKQYSKNTDNAKLSDAEKERVDALLALPDARPAVGDGTLGAWLLRISLWGKIKITHNNPDEKIRNVSMAYDQFLRYIDDQRRNSTYGKWNVEYPKIDLVKFKRKFYLRTGIK